MTLLRISLAQQRTGLIAMTVMSVIAGALNAVAFVQIAGTTQAERLAFAQQMQVLGAQLSYMLPPPVQLETLGGYLEWRAFGSLVLVLGVWAVISATGSGRGDEERGLVEQWLAAGIGRARYIAVRVVVFAAVTVIVIAATGVLTYVVGVGSGEQLSGIGILAMGIDLLATALACFAIGLAIAQLVTTRRAAGSIAAGVVLALFLVNGAARTADIGPIRWLSPFYLYERSRPLTSDGALDPLAILLLAITTAVLLGLGIAAFARRDLGATALPRAARASHATVAPSRDPLLRIPVVALLRQEWASTAASVLGIAAASAFLTSLAKTIVDSFMSSSVPFMRAYFERAGLSGYDSFIGAIWLTSLMLILSVYAIVQVHSWSTEDADGRLATILSTPVSRGRVVLERTAAFLVAMSLVCAAAATAVYVVATSQSLPLDAATLARATALVLAIPFAFSALGQLVIVWRPRLAVVLLSTVAAFSYLVLQFAPLFGWPEWLKNLSLYSLFGMPMSGEVNWTGIAGLVAVGIAATVGSLVAFRHRDVGA